MEDRFYDREFEQYVKQNADQYRMFPSENVWKGIHNTLHSRKRWYGFGLAFLLISTGVVSWVMFTTPAGKKQLSQTISENILTRKVIEEKAQLEEPVIVPVIRAEHSTAVSSVAIKYLTQKNLLKTSDKQEQGKNTINKQALLKDHISSIIVTVPLTKQSDNVLIARKLPSKPKGIVINQPLLFIPSNPITIPLLESGISAPPLPNVMAKAGISDKKEDINNSQYPLTIESVVNSYKYIARKEHLLLHFYLVPTISYRKLKENKSFLESARASNGLPNYAWLSDVNNVVTHKPDIGFELGFGVVYPLTKNLRLTSGFQFNTSKYDIRVITYPSEVATIALNSGNGSNSVSTITNYRNYAGGNRSNWLHNLYISASIPVGAEFIISGNNKTYLGIGGNVQPTYILANRAYLISTDYKNYAEVPSLTRKWNVNTNFEFFAGSSAGKLKWRIGPQVRYQTLSSFQDKYPVKEHLFDFGLKLGIILK